MTPPKMRNSKLLNFYLVFLRFSDTPIKNKILKLNVKTFAMEIKAVVGFIEYHWMLVNFEY